MVNRMQARKKSTLRIILWSILAFLGFVFVAIVIPLWIRSQRTPSPAGAGLAAAEVERNATKLALQATAEAFPTAQVGIEAIKPLDVGEMTVTPEATAYASVAGAVAAGVGAIIEVQPPFPATQYRINNAWYYDHDEGRQRTFVWAGSYARQGEAEPGLVIVQVYRRDEPSQPVETTVFDAPPGTGALTIASAEGMKLKLQSQEGKILYFDVASRAYSQP